MKYFLEIKYSILARARGACLLGITILFSFLTSNPFILHAEEAPYLEPGSLRLSNTLNLEGVFHTVPKGEDVMDAGFHGIKKFFPEDSTKNIPWKADWGENLLTEVAARPWKEMSARVLFEAQEDYADRYWRPININHLKDQKNDHLILHQAEGKVDQENWYLHGFSGVGRNGWE